MQLQPRYHHDRSGHGGRDLSGASDYGDHQAHHQEGKARQPSGGSGRADRPDPGHAAGQGGLPGGTGRPSAGHRCQGHFPGGRPGTFQGSHGGDRPAGDCLGHCRNGRGCLRGGRADRLSRHRPSRLYPGRRRRRRRRQRGGTACHRPDRPGRLSHHPDSGGAGHLRLEGDRI